jgi:hypothetical protein
MTDDESIAEFREKQARFYAIIEHCITLHQTIEDYPEDEFAAVLGGETPRARAIFQVVRGLESKLELIRAAVPSNAQEPWTQLASLLNKVRQSAKARNEIAHARPVQHGGMIQINVRTENGRIREAVSATCIEEGRWELHKGSKVDPVFWNEKSMREQYGRMDVLFGELIAVVKAIRPDPPT